MENKIPFTSYDFWAYLSAGFLFLFIADLVAGTGLLARDSWTIVQGVVAVSAAYAVGQLVASLSSLVFERLLVGKLLGYPRNVLFGQRRAWTWVRALMPGYFSDLPDQTQKAALEKGTAAGIASPGEGLFWAAFAHARAKPAVMSRLDNFLNLYGFCRNTALVAFLDAGLLYWSYRWGNGPDERLYWSWVATAVGVGMTFRYLKFYRHYAVEVFTSFAHSKES
jgi:hypothetical protein